MAEERKIHVLPVVVTILFVLGIVICLFGPKWIGITLLVAVLVIALVVANWPRILEWLSPISEFEDPEDDE